MAKRKKSVKQQLKHSAILIDSTTNEYACPNNRPKSDHYFKVHTSENLNDKKRPKCPYCKTKTKLVKYKKETQDA
jgi:uncharacterized Zn-finger protein